MSRFNRKRAADFLDDDDTATAVPQPAVTSAQPSKKSKRSANERGATSEKPKRSKNSSNPSLTGHVTKSKLTTSDESEMENVAEGISAKKSSSKEALQTTAKELDNGSDSSEDDPDQGAALLAGFDSDTEDPAEDKDLDLNTTGAIPNYKKTSKKLRNATQKGSDGPGAVYVGRIPHGFYEKQMREYFSQFGDITKLRLSRNRRTGASKHFAFVEFASDEVAKIVAETMDNYLMFGHILKCKYAPAENLHPDVWKGANKKFRKIPHQKLERQRLEAPKTVAQWEKKNIKENKKRKRNAAKLKEIGYELPLPTLQNPSAALEQRQLEAGNNGTQDVINGEVTQGTEPKAVEAVSKKTKEEKKSKVRDTAANPLTENNLGAQNASHYVKAPKPGGKSRAVSKPSSASTTATVNTTSTTVTSNNKGDKKRTKQGRSSTLTSSDNGDYDALSSIPLGIDAAGDEDAQGGASFDKFDPENISTVTGVADAELKKRKKDRKRAKIVEPTPDQLAAADVKDIAPFAQSANKKSRDGDTKTKSKSKNLKGILKNNA